MINFKGSDELYKPDVQHNVEGNAKVVGGHMQNKADVNITPTLDSERKVEEQVQEKIDRTPPTSAKPATYGSYPNYNPKSNKDV